MIDLKLIWRLQAAPGPSRELDFEIYKAATGDGSVASDDYTRRYTSSVDAAATIVPEGLNWAVWSDGTGRVYRPVPGTNEVFSDHDHRSSGAATPAIALCMAALLARMQP